MIGGLFVGSSGGVSDIHVSFSVGKNVILIFKSLFTLYPILLESECLAVFTWYVFDDWCWDDYWFYKQ